MKLSGLLTSLRVQEVCSVTSRTFLRGGGTSVQGSVLGLLPAQHEAPPLRCVPGYKAASALGCSTFRFPPRSASAWLTAPSCRLLQTELRRALSPSSQVFCGAVIGHASTAVFRRSAVFVPQNGALCLQFRKRRYQIIPLLVYFFTETS